MYGIVHASSETSQASSILNIFVQRLRSKELWGASVWIHIESNPIEFILDEKNIQTSEHMIAAILLYPQLFVRFITAKMH